MKWRSENEPAPSTDWLRSIGRIAMDGLKAMAVSSGWCGPEHLQANAKSAERVMTIDDIVAHERKTIPNGVPAEWL